MTTKVAEQVYLIQHLAKWIDKKWAVFNPNNAELTELPVIYGFNNGGSSGFFEGCLMAEDGTDLGGHGCSNEGYMLHDLGILEGARPDRHATFREHYPDGYRMAFVPYSEFEKATELHEALKRSDEKHKETDHAT